MKQLLHAYDNYIVVGLHECAFLVKESSVCELLAPPDDDKKKNETQPQQAQQQNGKEIQAVAVLVLPRNQIWCAVARYNKTLSLFCINDSCGKLESNDVEPCIVHNTVKRVTCLSFASIPSKNDNTSPLYVIIAGDLVGDATAYSLSSTPPKQKVLVGHTASMLTSVEIATSSIQNSQYILTADRDEKIRISAFPQAFVVEGYLLGHAQYVTCISVANYNDNTCVSCSGDATVRLWNFVDCNEIAKFATPFSLLPTRVAISPNGETVVVIYNASNTVTVLLTRNGTCLQLRQSLECPSQPLALQFLSNNRLLVLTREPTYLVEYKLNTDNHELVVNTASPLVTALQQVAVSLDICMPSTILEVDSKSGQVKLQKETDRRVGHDVKPWNKVERIQTAKEASKRRDKRKRAEKVDSKGQQQL